MTLEIRVLPVNSATFARPSGASSPLNLRRYRDRYEALSLAGDRDAQHMVLHALYVASLAAIDIERTGAPPCA
jgi:hypothetical protein